MQSGDIKGGAVSGLSSTATCTLDGHTVIIDSFDSAAHSDLAATAATDTYYARGDSGWDAFLADQGQTADTTTLQMQITNDAAGLTQQALDANPPARASTDAQQQILAAVTAALGGDVAQGTRTS